MDLLRFFSNYRELVRAKDAELWFGIMPKAGTTEPATTERPENVVDMPKQAVA